MDSPATTASVAQVLRQHAITDAPTWANERICLCGAMVRIMPPGPDFAEHVAAAVLASLNLTETRWRIHDPHGDHPRLYYVFTTENDARTALLALSDTWRLDEPNPEGADHG